MVTRRSYTPRGTEGHSPLSPKEKPEPPPAASRQFGWPRSRTSSRRRSVTTSSSSAHVLDFRCECIAHPRHLRRPRPGRPGQDIPLVCGVRSEASRQPSRRGGRAVESVLPVLVWIRRLVPLVIAVGVGVLALVAFAQTSHNGRLTGTWSGYIAGNPGSGVKRDHIRVVVSTRETGGSWRISATCHGPLTLESISNGYHHYLRKLARGATCAGGDVDCLNRVGPHVYAP